MPFPLAAEWMWRRGPFARSVPTGDAKHVVFSGEKVHAEYPEAVPDVTESTSFKSYRVLRLESLVKMKLTSNRRKDQVHVLDLIGVGLVDASWPAKYDAVLGARLQHLLDTPDG